MKIKVVTIAVNICSIMWIIITSFIELETILRFKGREPFVSDFRYNSKF